MQKSLFRKYLEITMVVILVSFIFLGSVVMFFITRYWSTERTQLLRNNAYGVANVAAKSLISEKNNRFTIDGERMGEFVSAFSENINAYILVTDVEGNIVMEHRGVSLETRSDLAGEAQETEKIDSEVVNEVIEKSEYSGVGTLNGYFDENCYIVAVPILIENGAGLERTVGIAVAASSTQVLSGYRAEMVKLFILAAMAAIIVAFGVAWLFSYRMTRPLRMMVDATKSFARGDFSVRVPVYSRDEVGELAVAFNQMAETLANSEATSRNFIANVSHELKTPMTTISGFIDGIIDGTIPPEKEQHYLGIVSQEVKRLSRLVQTMLALSRIDSGKLTPNKTRFDLCNTIFTTLLSFEDRIEEKHIEIRGLEDFCSLFVDGDPDMIHQVLYNLLENAVKFTNEGGYIEIHTAKSDGKVTVSIKNSGPGISPDDLKLIFERFYKTDKSRSKDKTGMGLGLYIVKTMVQLHGGQIYAQSVENEYTIFEFWIPYTDRREKKVRKEPLNRREKPGVVSVIDPDEKPDERLEPAEPPVKYDVVDITESAVEKEKPHRKRKDNR